MKKQSNVSVAFGLLIVLVGLALQCRAQNYPNRAVRVIVPFAAGGPADTLARGIGQKLSAALGQPIVIDDRPGANSNLGTELVAKAAPDGYTLLLTANTLTINPSLYTNLTYDSLRDFAPITLVASSILVLVVHPSVPARTVEELVALAKSQPGRLLYGSPGSGSPPHLAGEMFNTIAEVKLVHVPYKGITQALADLLGNQISLMFPAAPLALPQARSGKLRALATTGAKRAPAAPELPTIAEAGLPGYEVTLWYGLLAPAGTPPGIIDRLHRELVRIVQQKDLLEQWAALGADPLYDTPEKFAAYLRTDLTKWGRVVRASGAKID